MLWILISICIPWMFIMLLSGQVSDRVGRKPMFVAGAALAVLAAVPMFLLVDTAYIPLVVGGLLLMTIANGVVNGAQPALLAGMFPTGVRYSAISVCYQFGSVIGGGLLPLLATAALTAFGTSLAIGLILAGASAVSLVAALTVPAQDPADDLPAVGETEPAPVGQTVS